MHSRHIPLFPLKAVVFPRTPLPLHIFEERYKEMVGDAWRDKSEFGVVMAIENGIANAGCTVLIEKILEKYPDGRMDILTRGQHRFEIVSLNEEKDYLQGEVNYFDDDDFEPASTELRERVLSHYRVLSDLTPREQGEPNLEDRQLSFQLAQLLPDLDFLHTLLRQRSEVERLKQLNQFMNEFIPRQRTIQKMSELAPKNGFGSKPAGL